MSMYTTLLLITLAMFALAGLGLFLYTRNSTSSTLLDEVRARAAARAQERAFADTESLDDPYETVLDFSKAITATEIDDRFDGRGSLTDDQLDIINAIFTPHPDEPVVETIVVDDIWDSKYNR